MTATGYKIRLGDGSEIGPMDIQGVKDWYAQGLINKDSLVKRPGGTRWSPLKEVINLASTGASAAGPPRASGHGSRTTPRTPARRAARETPDLPPASAAPLSGKMIAIALASLVLVAGVGFVVWRVYQAGEEERRVRQSAMAEARYADTANGVTLVLPQGWVALRQGQTLVAVPPEAQFVFAWPGRGAFGYLSAEAAPRGVYSPDQYLDRVLAARRRSLPVLREESRRDVGLGRLAGRAAETAWETGGKRYRGLTATVRDGWTFIGLAAWFPEGKGDPRAMFEEIRRGLVATGAMAAHLEEALKVAAEGNPHLSRRAIEMLMGSSEAKVLTPEVTFRRGYEMAAQGLGALKSGEGVELGGLNTAAAGTLMASERLRLMAYLQLLKDGRLTTPEQDREMAGLMRRGALRLSNSHRARLQALYEKAITAAAE